MNSNVNINQSLLQDISNKAPNLSQLGLLVDDIRSLS